MTPRQLRNRLGMPGLLILALAAVTPRADAQDSTAGAPAAQARQVGFITMSRQSVPRVVTLPGRAVAQNQVNIRPRVDGFVAEILYDPSKPIKRGDPMFRIDPATYEAALEQAKANLASAKAAVPQTTAAYERAQKLLGSGSTQVTLEEAQAAMEQAKAAEMSAQAALTLAQTELDWTMITSLLDGLSSVAQVSPGDLVTAGQSDALATVTQMDPIEVDMYEPSARMQRVRANIESGRLRPATTINAQLQLENGVNYATRGEIVAPGFQVSTSTGAIDFRFRFQNPEMRILPGMFVRGRIEVGTIEAYLVPQLAATRGNDGKLSAWVIQDGKSVHKILTDDGVHENNWIITEGLNDGDQLIVNGTTGLTEGADLAPVEVTIDADGVVRDATADATSAGAAAPAPEPASAPATTPATTPGATDTAPEAAAE